MLVAVIDLGTNTFNLLIAELNKEKNSFIKKHSDRIAVKLGEGGINKGHIAEMPFNRGIQALMQYKTLIDQYKVKDIRAFATSAIRTASNGKLFIDTAFEKTGIKIDMITGEREAELIYYGNRLALNMNDEASLIMDIGGGSTEFIIANKSQLFWKHSFLLGAARLLEKFKPEDPITDATIKSIQAYLKEQLQPLINEMKKYKIEELIGSSGAFDSFVDMIGAEFGNTGLVSGKKEYEIKLDQYFVLSKKVIHSTIEERKHMKGLIAMRVDMIVISFLLADFIIKEFNLTKFRSSTYSLKEGIIAELLMKN